MSHSFYNSRRYLGRSPAFYLLCSILFTVGFFLGVLQSSGWCNERTHVQNDSEIRNSKELTFLVVVIFSSPLNFENRETIRNTWLKSKGNNSILHFFAIGVTSLKYETLNNLKLEHSSSKDLLLLDSVGDSYSRLSEKLREVFRWLDKNINYTYVLKVDDDSFVHLDALYNAVMSLPQKRVYWGFFDGQANIKVKGKWAEQNWFLCDHYLPYAKGGGYMLSQDLIHLIVSVSDHLSLYQNEDVTLGTWLSPFEIKRLHDPRFDTEFRSRGCLNSYLVTHKQSLSMMMEKYKHLSTSGKLCHTEYKIRNSYLYNWNVPPSRCCSRNDSKIP